MKPDSPFQYNRWESDIDHIIWLPPEFSEWEGKKCVYITGSRGTGKTTGRYSIVSHGNIYSRSRNRIVMRRGNR